MKAQVILRPAWLNVLVYFLALWLATLIAGAVPALNDFIFFFLVSLTISWILLRYKGMSILSLGFVPRNKKDLKSFFTGIGIGVLMLVSTLIITLLLTKDHWNFNSHVDPIYLVIAFVACFWSAFVQEFVFRGYPFQTLLKQYSVLMAQGLIAIPFGLMHLDRTMDLSTMSTVMLTTGLGSILFGLAYLKTGKLFMPVGLHLGWNYAQQIFPRTTGQGNSGIIMITDSHNKYAEGVILAPYLLVVILAIAGFSIAIRSN